MMGETTCNPGSDGVAASGAEATRRGRLRAGGAFAQGAGPETSRVVLGTIARTDAAALVAAMERGLVRA